MTLKTRVYRAALGRSPAVRLKPEATSDSPAEVQVGWRDLIAYLLRRGAMPRIRGALRGWRLARCGGRLFIGRRVDLIAPGRITVGHNVYLADHVHINGVSRDGIAIGSNVRLREGVWIQATSTLDNPGVGLAIGAGSYLGPRCLIGAGGGVSIGSNVTFGAEVHVLAENHAFERADVPIASQGVTRDGITIEDNVWIGNKAIILDGVRVGSGAVIGAGAVVTKDVPARAIAAGNPARIVGTRDESPAVNS